MPYIPTADRDRMEETGEIRTPGELNYYISMGLHAYAAEHGISYQTYNDILGALDGAGKEFYRRFVAPYEDQKIKENGDLLP